MTSKHKHFTPNKLSKSEPLVSYVVISGNYFKVANQLRSFTQTGHNDLPNHYFVFPAVTMFVASFEAFIQEHLAYAAYALRDSKEGRGEELAKLKSREDSYKNFKTWLKEVYRQFDRNGAGIDTNSDVYRNLIALKELRNSIVHYNPFFIEHVNWPSRLEQALHCSKLEVFNSSWVTHFSKPEVADWAHKSIKDAVELFAQISGAQNPFTAEVLPWE